MRFADDPDPWYTPLFWMVLLFLFVLCLALCSAGSDWRHCAERPQGALVCVKLDGCSAPLLAERCRLELEESTWHVFGRKITTHQYRVRLLRRGRASVHWSHNVTIESVPRFLASELR